MREEILSNFDQHIFFHGTSPKSARKIAQQGFRVWLRDKEVGRYASGGNLGNGIYITCNWRMALWFGPVLLRVGLRSGTRVLNAAVMPDSKVLSYLQREFGREILKKPPWKVVPENKKLRQHELIALFRYHYEKTWERAYGFAKWPKQREQHARLVDVFRSLLIRYGFHGYGNPEDDNGIVVFSGDRLVLVEKMGKVPEAYYKEWIQSDFDLLASPEDLQKISS